MNNFNWMLRASSFDVTAFLIAGSYLGRYQIRDEPGHNGSVSNGHVRAIPYVLDTFRGSLLCLATL
jgi:hypothetical protein